jgi:hypothetical protein
MRAVILQWIRTLRVALFGTETRSGGSARKAGTRLVEAITTGGVRQLPDDLLMSLVDELLTIPQLRRPLRGNTRFLGSVAAQFHRKRALSPRQREGVLNVLERAYPHNLVAELTRWTR